MNKFTLSARVWPLKWLHSWVWVHTTTLNVNHRCALWVIYVTMNASSWEWFTILCRSNTLVLPKTFCKTCVGTKDESKFSKYTYGSLALNWFPPVHAECSNLICFCKRKLTLEIPIMQRKQDNLMIAKYRQLDACRPLDEWTDIKEKTQPIMQFWNGHDQQLN